jgi:hypothetical protein
LEERKVRSNTATSRNNIYDTGVRNCTPSLSGKMLFLQPSSHVISPQKPMRKKVANVTYHDFNKPQINN